MSKGKGAKEKGAGSGSLAEKLSAAIGVALPDQERLTPTAGPTPYFSAKIQGGKDRAGRAPYNFVPLPETVVANWPKPPRADVFDETGISGEIHLRITALTDFYVRGMWSLKDYLKHELKPRREGERPPLTPDPFRVDAKLRLPGSSLRGMIRTLVEILGKAPLDPVNDTQLFFRAVGASAIPGERSFDPNAVSYRSRLVVGDGRRENPTYPKAQAGYLYGSRTGWKIQPAKKAGSKPTQWYRIEFRNDRKPDWRIKTVEFKPATIQLGSYPHHSNVFYEFGIVGRDDWHEDIQDRPDHRIGTIIRSGFIERKYMQWIILERDDRADSIPIPNDDVEAYKNDRNLTAPKELRYSDSANGVPCFYVKWFDKNQHEHVSFGHTPYFRLPYRTTPQMANGTRQKPEHHLWDFGQLLFGRVHKAAGQSARGRVFFEDGILNGPQLMDTNITSVVLGEPKPTTYQHYLVQDSSNSKESIHWDSDEPRPVLRGHKLYWHRPGADPRPSVDLLRKEKVLTEFRKALAGNSFTARVRFENLSRTELGLLFTAIQLPSDCRHHFGMAKPLGFGSFHVEMTGFHRIDRRARYSHWFDSAEQVCTGFESAESSATLAKECRLEFAQWYLDRKDLTADDFENRLWEDSRLVELRALLRWREFRSKEERGRWLGRTRYMGFGEVMQEPQWGNPEDSVKLNEYLQSGYPEKPPTLAPRRPLPPASQVDDLSDRNLPENPTPPWLPKAELDALREKKAKARLARNDRDRGRPPRRGR